jgi:hypothetical protein
VRRIWSASTARQPPISFIGFGGSSPSNWRTPCPSKGSSRWMRAILAAFGKAGAVAAHPIALLSPPPPRRVDGLIRRTPGVFCFGRAWRRENTVYQHHIGHPVGADSMGAWNRKFLHVGFFQCPHSNRQRPWGALALGFGTREREETFGFGISTLANSSGGGVGLDRTGQGVFVPKGYVSGARCRTHRPIQHIALFPWNVKRRYVFSWGLGYAAIRRRTPVRSA